MKESCYVIASQSRSGTGLLSHLLCMLQLGQPYEIKSGVFEKITVGDSKWKYNFLKSHYKLSPEASCIYYSRIVFSYQISVMLQCLGRWIPDIKFVYLYRKDILHRSISNTIARQSGVYRRCVKPGVNITGMPILQKQAIHGISRALTYDFQGIAQCLLDSVDGHKKWESFFEEMAISPLRVYYEDLVADKVGILRQIASFLEAPVEHQNNITSDAIEQALLLPSAPVKQSDAVNDEWEAQFREDFASILPYIDTTKD